MDNVGTLVYGRHLGELVPFLQACDRFQLEAACLIKGQERSLSLASGIPIAPNSSSKRFDSQLEKNFARDFGKLTADWDLVREPEPMTSGNRWFFPDFEVRHRRNRDKRWFIEVIGFWHPEYLRDKFEKLRATKLSNFIICIDRKNACGEVENWKLQGAHVVEFVKSIDANAVLGKINTGNL